MLGEQIGQNPENLSFLKEHKPLVDGALSDFFDRQSQRIQISQPSAAELLPQIKGFVERDGKIIRPSLVMLSYEAFSGIPGIQVLPEALSVEFMHDSFLVHDDLYDHIEGEEETRRGERVLHLGYEEEFDMKDSAHDSNWNPKVFSKHAAVAASQVMLSLEARALYESQVRDRIKAQALASFWGTIEETWLGQGADLLSKGKPIQEVTPEEILETELSRAGVYTVEFPLHLGAILADREEALSDLTKYARPVGLAFEVYDDVLGIFGEEAEIGKIMGDLAEGKRTLLLAHALQNGSTIVCQELLSLLGQRNVTYEQIQRAREIFINTQALFSTRAYVEELVVQAKDALVRLPIPNRYKDQLAAFAEFVINRRK